MREHIGLQWPSEYAPLPPANNVHKIRESLPDSTVNGFSPPRVFSMYCKILSKLPLESFTPMMLGTCDSFCTVAGASALPVRAGILYSSIGISTVFATVS